MSNLRIYPFIIVCILLLSVFIPKLYKDMFSSRVDKTFVNYSSMDEDFVKMTIKSGLNKEVLYSNMDESKLFTLDEYKGKLPFFYASDLFKIDKFPEKFAAYANDVTQIRKEKSFEKLKPKSITEKAVNIHLLFESNPKYSSLEYPKDIFYIGNEGMTFVNTKENSVNEEKTKQYNVLLLEKGAVFPLVKAFGNPTTRKPYDSGYFIKDSKNNFFHVMQIDNKAVVKKVSTNGMDIVYMKNKEDLRREYYGFVVDSSSNVYLLMYGTYDLIKLPIDDYNYKTHTLSMYLNPINRVFTISYEKDNENIIKTYVTNVDYELEKKNTYKTSLIPNELYELGKMLFVPFEIKTELGKQSFVYFDLQINKNAFFVSFIISILFVLYLFITRRDIKKHLVQIALILCAGIYSIITLALFSKLLINKQKKEMYEKNK